MVKNDFLVLKFGTIGLSPAQPAHRLPIGQSLKIQAQFLQPGTSLLVQRCTYCNGFLSMQMGKRGRDLIFSNSCNFRCLLLASLQARQYHLRVYDDQKVPFVFCSHKSLCANETIPFSQCSGRKTEREAGMRLERRERRKEWDKGPQSESRLSSVTSGNGILEDGEVRS